MSANVGYVTMNVLPSAKGFGAALKGEIDPALGSVGDDAGKKTGSGIVGGLKSMIGPAMLATGALAMAGFVKGAISSASDLQQATGAVDAIFKTAAPAMANFGATAAKSFGLAKTEVAELSAVIGAQLKNAGVSMDQLAPQTQNLIAAGADMAAMFGGTAREAVEAISSALKGERDPIERYGVSLNQAAIDAKAASLGFEKVGGSLSAEANAAASMALIMEQTADAHGAAARESDSLASRQQQLAAGWENIKASIGGVFLPVAAGAVGILADLANGIGPLIQSAGPGLASTFGFLAPIIQNLGGALLQLLPNFSPIALAFQTLAPVLPQLGALLANIAAVLATNLTVAAQAITPVMQALTTHLSGVLAVILPTIADLFARLSPVISQAAYAVSGIVSALAPLVGVLLETLIPVIQSLLPIVQTVFGFVVDVVTVAVNLVSGIIQAVMMALNGDWDGAWQQIGKTLGAAWDGILKAVGKAIDGIVKWFAGLLPAIMSTLAGIGSWLINTGRDLIDGLFSGIKALWRTVGDWFASLGGIVGGWVSGAGKWLWDAGRNIVQGLLDGLASLAGTVGKFFLNLLPGWIREPFKAALGIHSPSRLFAGYGVNIGEGLVNGIDSMQSDVAKSALGLATAAADAVDGMSLAMGADVSGAVPDGGLYGAAAGGSRGSSQTLNYTQNGGQGLTSEQELIKAARRLKPTP